MKARKYITGAGLIGGVWLQEVYPRFMSCDPKWMVLREYYCPGCQTQLEVEAVPQAIR